MKNSHCAIFERESGFILRSCYSQITCSISQRYCKVLWLNISSILLTIKSMTFNLVTNCCSEVNLVLSEPLSILRGRLLQYGTTGGSMTHFSASFTICLKHSGTVPLIVCKLVLKMSVHFIASHAIMSVLWRPAATISAAENISLPTWRPKVTPTSNTFFNKPGVDLKPSLHLPRLYFAGLQWVTDNFPG